MRFNVWLGTEGELKIYTMSGKLVRKLNAFTGTDWDGENESGEKVARGIYIYIITIASGVVW